MNPKATITSLQEQLRGLYQQNRFEEAIKPATELYKITAAYYGAKSVEAGTCLNTLGTVLFNSQHFNDAERAFFSALHLLLGQPAVDELQIWVSFHNLGYLYEIQRQYLAAKNIYIQSITVMKKRVGNRHTLYSSALRDLALLKQQTGHLDHALLLLQKMVEIDNTTHADYVDAALPHEKIARILLDKNERLQEAQSHLRTAIAIRLQHVPSTDPTVIDSLWGLVEISKQMKDYETALTTQSKLVDIAKSASGANSQEYARECNNLAEMYFATERFADAQVWYGRSLVALKSAVGDAHPIYMSVMNNLANACFRAGDYAAADTHYAEVFASRLETHDTNTTEFRNAFFDWVDFYKAIGSPEKIPPLYEQVIKVQAGKFGETAPATLYWVSLLARLHMDSGNYHAAIPLQERLLETIEQISDQAQIAAAMDGLAYSYTQVNRYMDAIRLYGEALVIWEKALANDPLTMSNKLYRLGNVYRESGHPNKAKGHLERALKIRRENSTDAILTGQAVSELGIVFRDLGDYHSSEKLMREAYEIAESNREKVKEPYPVALTNLGQFYTIIGEYRQADLYLQRGLKAYVDELGEEHPRTAFAYNTLGEFYRESGNPILSRNMLLKALDIYQRLPRIDAKSKSITLNGLGLAYQALGDIAQAQDYFGQAIDILQIAYGDNSPLLAGLYGNLASIQVAIGNKPQAKVYLEKELFILESVFGKNSSNLSTVLNNLASVYADSGRELNAVNLYKRAADILQAEFGFDHISLVSILNNNALIYMRIGARDTARDFLERAINITRAALGDHNTQLPIYLANLVSLNKIEGKYETAASDLLKAIEIVKETAGVSHPNLISLYDNLSDVYGFFGQFAQAAHVTQESVRVADHMLAEVLNFSSEGQRASYLRMTRRLYNCYLSIALHHDVTRDVYDFVLRNKGVGGEILTMQRAAILEGKYPALSDDWHRLMELKVELSQRQLENADPQQVSKLQDQRDQLEIRLAQQMPELNAVHQLGSINHREIANRLSADTALVEFVYFLASDFRIDNHPDTPHYVAFVLTSSGDLTLTNLGEAAPIEEAVAAFRASITFDDERRFGQDPQPSLTSLRPGEEPSAQPNPTITADTDAIRRLVWQPVADVCSQNTRLFVVPDGDLTRLPFGLITQDNGRLVMDDYVLTYLSVGRDLLRFGQGRHGQVSEPLIVAAPDFESPVSAPSSKQDHNLDHMRSAMQKFAALPGAYDEGMQIAALFGIEPLTGSKAVKRTIQSRKSPSIVHFATHGFFAPPARKTRINGVYDVAYLVDVPSEGNFMLPSKPKYSIEPQNSFLQTDVDNPLLRSGLALSGANIWIEGGYTTYEMDNGLLTAEEVMGMDLTSTDLVVLSACETGLGILESGEGVLGLRRAFAIAGAKALIVSLWKTPDKPTQELMIEFYQLALVGLTYGEALYEAQKRLRAKYKRPRNWGAFIFQGDPSVRYIK